jgi:hypothetical protein
MGSQAVRGVQEEHRAHFYQFEADQTAKDFRGSCHCAVVAQTGSGIPATLYLQGFTRHGPAPSELRNVGEATSVGASTILRTAWPVEARRVRLQITRSPVCPALTEFALFASI